MLGVDLKPLGIFSSLRTQTRPWSDTASYLKKKMKSVTIAAGQSLQKWWKSLKSLNSFIMYKIALLWNHKFTTHQSSVKLCIISALVHQCIRAPVHQCSALWHFTGFVLWSSNAVCKLCTRSDLWTREQCNSKLSTCSLVIEAIFEPPTHYVNYAPEVNCGP